MAWEIKPLIICGESGVLALLCTLDMLSTAWLVKCGAVTEANPIMRFYVEAGIPWFIVFKILLFAGPLYVLELLRRRHPQSIRNLLRMGIALYLICYGLSVWQVNHSEIAASAQAGIKKTPVNRSQGGEKTAC